MSSPTYLSVVRRTTMPKHGIRQLSRQTKTELPTTSSTAAPRQAELRKRSAMSSPEQTPPHGQRTPPLSHRRKPQHCKTQHRWTSTRLERNTTRPIPVDVAEKSDIGLKTANADSTSGICSPKKRKSGCKIWHWKQTRKR